MTQDNPSTPLRREELALCAHDLRGALTVIAGYTDMLRRDDLTPAERMNALSGIELAIARADSLVGDVLAGRNRSIPGSEPVDVAALARQAVADAIVATGREVEATIRDEPVILGDAIGLARVIENLLSNACKYAPEGRIDVAVLLQQSTPPGSDVAVVEVSDCGPGIPEAEREHVFEPFARLDRDASAPGTGLGLTVVASVVERMKGRVAVLDRAGGGALVRLEFPA